MVNIRELINSRPWLGWAIAGILLVAGVWMYFHLGGQSDPYSQERLTEEVTIRFMDTGDEITMLRGRMEKELRSRSGQIDGNQGIVNPKTSQPTGFPIDKRGWEEAIKRINTEKVEAAQISRIPPGKTAPAQGTAPKSGGSQK